MGTDLVAQIQLASMLINLGLVTVERIKTMFADNGHDDETLAQIMSEVDARIARRS